MPFFKLLPVPVWNIDFLKFSNLKPEAKIIFFRFQFLWNSSAKKFKQIYEDVFEILRFLLILLFWKTGINNLHHNSKTVLYSYIKLYTVRFALTRRFFLVTGSDQTGSRFFEKLRDSDFWPACRRHAAVYHLGKAFFSSLVLNNLIQFKFTE